MNEDVLLDLEKGVVNTDGMTGGIPQGAVGVSVVVLLYSAGCLTLTTLLTCLLISFGEAWSCMLHFVDPIFVEIS